MKRLWHIVKRLVAGLLLLAIGLVVGLYALTRTAYARRWLRDEVTSALHDDLGLTATFRDVELGFFPPSAEVIDLSVQGADDRPFATVGRTTLALSPLELLRGRVRITELTLEEPRVRLVVEGSVITNLPSFRRPSPSRSGGGTRLGEVLTDLGVVAGRFEVEVRDAPGGALDVVLDDANLDVTFDGDGNPAARVLVTSGAVTQGEHRYDIGVVQARALLRGERARIRDLRVEVGDLRVAVPRASVTLAAPFDGEATVGLELPLGRLRGFPLPAPPLEGLVHLTAQARRLDGRFEADGQVRIEERFSLADFLKVEDLFEYGMVPQFMARFDNIVLLNDLTVDVLKAILLKSYDSPFVRSKRFFEVRGVDLEIEDLAAALIAEVAEKHSRTGARALRTIFGNIVNRR